MRKTPTVNCIPDNPTDAEIKDAIMACAPRQAIYDMQMSIKMRKSITFAMAYGMSGDRRAGILGRQRRGAVYA